VIVLLPSVGGEKEVTDYFKLFDYDIALLTKALPLRVSASRPADRR